MTACERPEGWAGERGRRHRLTHTVVVHWAVELGSETRISV